MKSFKQYLIEKDNFILKKNPNSNPHDEIYKFMKTVPFEGETSQGHQVGFKSSLHGLGILTNQAIKHDEASRHFENLRNDIGTRFHEYAGNTHRGLIMSMQDAVAKNPKLPKHLAPFVPSAFKEIETEAIKAREIKKALGDTVHPSDWSSTFYGSMSGKRDINDEMGHLSALKRTLDYSSGDHGYVLSRDEMQ
jgi:hypothetical protein